MNHLNDRNRDTSDANLFEKVHLEETSRTKREQSTNKARTKREQSKGTKDKGMLRSLREKMYPNVPR